MLFVERNNVVQDLSAARSHPSFRDAILPGGLDPRALGFQACCLQEGNDIGIEYQIAIEDRVPKRPSIGEGLTQLLDDPFSSWIAGYVEVQDFPTPMLDDEEAVEQFECHGRHRKEVEGGDHLTMILQEGKPLLRRVTTATNSLKVTGHGPFRDEEAELPKFPVDLGRAPIRVLLRQTPDQDTNLIGDLRPAAARSRAPTPIEAKTGAVPADDRFGLHNNQRIFPPGPDAAKSGPEEPVESIQMGTRPFPLEHGDLLPEGENFEGGVAATAKEHADCGQD